MYKEHYWYLVIISLISYGIFKYFFNISLEINSIITVLATFTGFTMTSLSILLSSKYLELQKIDIRKRNKKEIKVILSYYQFSIAISLITIMTVLLKVNNIITNILFVISMYSVYLCLRIVISIFTRD